jgi:Raf kinase inhibitor-like YbhB/YbcL family protein
MPQMRESPVKGGIYEQILNPWTHGILMRALLCLVAVLSLMGAAPMSFRLSSAAFSDGRNIPARYSCDGENISPPLAWADTPAGTKSFALVVSDPDTARGTLLHWGIYNIRGDADHLGEAFPSDGSYPQAHNDMGNTGYSGPCPPPGSAPHHYRFRLMALDVATLNLATQPQAEAIEKAAQPHILGIAELTGLYARQNR